MRNPAPVGFRAASLLALVTATTAAPAEAMFIVNQPWVRPAQIARSTEAYMDLTSTDGAALVSVTTAVARTASIRAPGKSTVAARSVALPAQTSVALAPGRYRVALSSLQRTLQPGDRVLMTLTIELANGTRQDIPVDAEVRLHSPIDDEHRAHSHAHAPH